jgi:hypothetical protein
MYDEKFSDNEQLIRTLKGWQFNRKEHGSLFDRGSADSYYGRGPRPHYGGIGGCPYPETTDLSPDERAEYMAGYNYNERYGDKKDWG